MITRIAIFFVGIALYYVSPSTMVKNWQPFQPQGWMGTFTGARKYVLETFAKTESAQMKKRVARYMVSIECPKCGGKRLRPEALRVKFGAGLYQQFPAFEQERLFEA